MKRRSSALVALLFAFALVAAACGDTGDTTTTTAAPPVTDAPTTTTTEAPPDTPAPTAAPTTTTTTTTLPPPPPGKEVKACEISDTGGIDDRSFNQSAYAGLERAAAELEGVTIDFLESITEADYEPNLRVMLDAGCDVIILPGFLWIGTILDFAPANPDAKFAIIDVGGLGIPNLREITFQTDEASFLAGYTAAGVTETGIVGTYGGVAIPSVTIFMDGFVQGVDHYNSVKGTDVEVKGWDIETQTGLFTEDFEAVDKGQQLTQSLLEEGADIVMPVGGKIGLGACAAIDQAGGVEAGLYHIGVDVDWNFSAEAECGEFTLTSVLKQIEVAVFNTVNNVLALDALGNPYLGTLANGGVGIAKTGAWDTAVSGELAGEVADLEAAITSAGSLAAFLESLSGG